MIAGFQKFFAWLSGLMMPVLIALAVLAVVSAGLTTKWAMSAHRARKAEAVAQRLDKDLTKARQDLLTCQASVDTLTVSLERQNAAVEALQADGEERTRRAAAAVQEARRLAQSYRKKIARLERAHPSGDMCTAARTLAVETLKEDRP